MAKTFGKSLSFSAIEGHSAVLFKLTFANYFLTKNENLESFPTKLPEWLGSKSSFSRTR